MLYVYRNCVYLVYRLTPSAMVIRIGRGGKFSPLSIMRQDFKDIIDKFHLPHAFVESMASNNGSLCRFVEYEQVGAEFQPSFLCKQVLL